MYSDKCDFVFDLQGLDILMQANLKKQVAIIPNSRIKCLHVIRDNERVLETNCNLQLCCFSMCLQVMNREATLEQDMEKEVYFNWN